MKHTTYLLSCNNKRLYVKQGLLSKPVDTTTMRETKWLSKKYVKHIEKLNTMGAQDGITVLHSMAKNSSDNLPSYSQGNRCESTYSGWYRKSR